MKNVYKTLMNHLRSGSSGSHHPFYRVKEPPMVFHVLSEFLSLGFEFSDEMCLRNSKKPPKIKIQPITTPAPFLWGKEAPYMVSHVLGEFLSCERDFSEEMCSRNPKGPIKIGIQPTAPSPPLLWAK